MFSCFMLKLGNVGLNIYFARKTENKIPTFIFFVNNKKFVHFSYQRFLEKQIRQNIEYTGCPINIIFKNKSNEFE